MARFRVYAVTGKDRRLCSPLFLLIIMQAVCAVVSTAFYLRLPGWSFDACSLTPVDGYPVPSLPEEISDTFRVCGHEQWKFGTLSFIVISLAFGALSPSNFYLWSSRISRVLRYRYFCLLDTLRQSQERTAAKIPGDNGHLGRDSARWNDLFHGHIFRSILCPGAPVYHNGR